MQQTTANAPSGKLDTIKNIGTMLPMLDAWKKRCFDARVNLDSVLTALRETSRNITHERETAILREQKEKEYAGLIQQRKDERMAAERKIDERTESRLAAAKSKEVELSAQKNSPFCKGGDKQMPERETKMGFLSSEVKTPVASATPPLQKGESLQPQRTWTPNNQQQRPSFGGAQQRPPYPPRDGQRPPYPPRDGQRPPYPPRDGQQRPPFTPGAQRSPYPPRDGQRPPYPPRDGQQRSPFAPGAQRPPYPPRDGARPFGPRPAGMGPRPFGPRPAGAMGTGPRPAGTGIGILKPTEKFVPKPDTFAGKKKVKNFNTEEKSSYDKRALLRRGIIEEQEIEERMLTRIFKTKKAKENSGQMADGRRQNLIMITTNTVTVKTLSEKIGKTVPEIIKQLMVLGSMCTINSVIDFETASLVAMEFGFELELNAAQTFEEKLGDVHRATDDEGKLERRPPVVTVMGHVDHGKTSLLDAIRKTNVQTREFGGITQHIGAYQVTVPSSAQSLRGAVGDAAIPPKGRKITFIDTPGHAAFDKMRARGAKITDIAILLVAGDDGVMPQTIEAIKHIQKNKLPMLVAVNKMDKREANIDRVKEQLSQHNVLTEEWGGDAILVPISAVTGMGLDKLLEMILLVADMNDYKANPSKEAQGVVIDAKLDKAKGPTVTVIVQSGTLKVGDTLLAGTTYGKVRSMTDENGKPVKKATPSMPVSVLGFSEVPKAGDAAYVVDAQLTKQVVSERKTKEQVTKQRASTKVAADIDAIARLDESAKKQLNVIIKGDVSGSVEAIIQSVKNIISDEVTINVISSGVGVVNDNDVALSEMAGALLIAFNVKTSPTAKIMAKKLKIKIHEYNVIYQIFDFITDQMVRLFSPKFNEVYHGRAEVRAVFKSSAIGLIAGCMVTDGKILRDTTVKLHRGEEVLGQYKIASLKIVKDDVKEVAKGFECGIKLEGTVEVKIGDQLECVGKEQQPIIYGGKKYEF